MARDFGHPVHFMLESWADDTIGCKRPAATPSTYFYTLPNEVRVATSIAYARGYTPAEDELGASSFDPMYNSSSIWTYESIEKSTLVLEPSFSTARSVVSHVPHCKVFDRDGLEIVSHYDRLYPERDYGDGYLMLSLEDILRAAVRARTTERHAAILDCHRVHRLSSIGVPGASQRGLGCNDSTALVQGHEMDDTGGERAPLRLAGLELVALVDIQNYHVPFRWPSGTFNPFGVPVAGEIECSVLFPLSQFQTPSPCSGSSDDQFTIEFPYYAGSGSGKCRAQVRFEVLRNQFTPVQWFYDRERPVALQHGLRIVVLGTGSVGYFAVGQLLSQLLLSVLSPLGILDAGPLSRV